ncbi:MAG: hypothetical protein EOO73_11765 [Myxococcales bacterium]|nr:MAG: hypothetical protein EOO73_11765 [Myxococcales bacterium]
MPKPDMTDAMLREPAGAAMGRSILTMQQAFARVLYRACEADARSIECQRTEAGELCFTIGNPAAAEALQVELRRDLPPLWCVAVR